jgi:hypothetical protein
MKGEEAMASRNRNWDDGWDDEFSERNRKRRRRPDRRKKNSRSFEDLGTAEKKRKHLSKPFGDKSGFEVLRGGWYDMSRDERLEESGVYPLELDEDPELESDSCLDTGALEDSGMDYSPDDWN